MKGGGYLAKSSTMVFAPVNGEMIEANQELEANASLINEDCYGAGWMFKIQPSDIIEFDDLIHGREAVEKWLKADIEKYGSE